MKRILLATLLFLTVPAAAQEPYSYQNITTDTTTTIKSSSGYLHTVGVNIRRLSRSAQLKM